MKLYFIINIILIFILYNMNMDMNEKFNNKEKIVFSLTCHESPDCVIDLIENIKKCFIHFNVLILISCTDNINDELSKLINKFDYVKIVTIRDHKNNIWGNIDLFHQHMLNVDYLIKNNIDYNYFWLLASNEYFFKIVEPEHLYNNMMIVEDKIELSNDEVNKFYDDFLNKSSDWYWLNYMKMDTYTVNILKENKIILDGMQHEGLVLIKNIAEEIFKKYDELLINKNSVHKGYVLEEIFIISYLKSRYKIKNSKNTFCKHYLYDGAYSNLSPEDFYNKLLNEKMALSIKPVIRDYNNGIRTIIRKNINK